MSSLHRPETPSAPLERVGHFCVGWGGCLGPGPPYGEPASAQEVLALGCKMGRGLLVRDGPCAPTTASTRLHLEINSSLGLGGPPQPRALGALSLLEPGTHVQHEWNLKLKLFMGNFEFLTQNK